MIEIHKNLRTFYQSRDKEILAAESSPQIRTIKVAGEADPKSEGYKNYTYYLGFPYIQFYLIRGSLHLTFSKKPVLNIRRDKVSFPFLPNVYVRHLAVCQNLPTDLLGIPFPPSEKGMEEAVSKFWTTGFYVRRSWFGCWFIPDGIRKNNLGDDLNIVDGQVISHKIEPTDFEILSCAQLAAWEEGTRKEGVDFISNLEWPHSFKDVPKNVLRELLTIDARGRGLPDNFVGFKKYLNSDIALLAAKSHG